MRRKIGEKRVAESTGIGCCGRGDPASHRTVTRRVHRFSVPNAMCVVLLALATVARAGTFTVDIERTDGGTVVIPGESVEYVIRGTLSNEDANLGLALFLYNLQVASAGLSPINLQLAVTQDHPDGDMNLFDVLLGGYSGDYNGTPIGDELHQCGGAQNTIQNDPGAPPFLPFPFGAVVQSVAHGAGAIFHEGTLTPPIDAAPGQYTFQIVPGSLIGNQINSFDGVSYLVAPTVPVIGAALTFQFGCSGNQDCGAGQTCDVVTGLCSGVPIPTVSEWGVVVMSLLLLSAGTIVFSPRRANASA